MSRNLLRRFDRLRRRYSTTLSTWFYRTLGRDRFLCSERLAPHDVKRIMVLRNNKRIGNMYFLLPFMHALREMFPQATIELMVINASQVQVFKHTGIDQTHVSNFSFASIPAFLRLIRQQRKVVYDLLLMPHGSATDTIIGGLLHARNKIATWSDEKSSVYRHSIKLDNPSKHAALTPLALLEAIGGKPLPAMNHLMVLTQAERQTAANEVAAIRGDATYCIAYFRGARGNKIIADESWQLIRQGFDGAAPNAIRWIEILSPDVTQPLQTGTSTWQSADLRQLAAFLSACDLFICGDTGPLHLADAAGARCLGLFTATSPVHYGCLGQTCINVTDLDNIDAASVLQAIDTDHTMATTTL